MNLYLESCQVILEIFAKQYIDLIAVDPTLYEGFNNLFKLGFIIKCKNHVIILHF